MEKNPPPPSKKPKAGLSAAARALQFLARREHTRLELERKLAPHVPNSAELKALLDDFSARGWLSDTRAVEQIVQAKRGRLGPARIRQTLLQKGVSAELIEPALRDLKDTELDAARSVLARKFKTLRQTPADRARQVRFLQSRGFSIEIAMRVVRSRDSDGRD